MKEKKHAAKKILVMVMAVMVLFTMVPHTAEAAAKKAVTVSVKSAKKTKSGKLSTFFQIQPFCC